MADANIRAVITAEDRASRVVQGFGSKVGKFGNTVFGVARKVSLAVAGATAAVATMGIKTAANLEAARQGFITLLGSAKEADQTMARIKKEAARTPFEVPGLTAATQLLASVTKNGDKAIDIILDVGEGLAAMGRGQAELDRISVNLQQIAASGRATALDIKQFAFAGIPIFEMLQEQTGKSGEALADFISQGGVTFDLLTEMFDKANDKGGRFFNAFKNQLGTFNQSWSNLKDTFLITAADIVTQIGLFDKLKGAMKGVGDWIANNKDAIVASIKAITEFIGRTIEFIRTKWTELKEYIDTHPMFKLGVQIAVADLRILREKTTSIIESIKTIFKGLSPEIKQAFKTLGKAIFVVLVGILTIVASIVNAIDYLLRKISQAVEAINRLKQSGGGKAVSLLGFVPGAAALGPAKFLKNAITGRQHGGPVTGGHPYIVGEKGPELFVPRQSGDIRPNAGGGQMIVNISPQIGVFAGSAMERRKLAEQIYNDLKDVANSKGINLQTMIQRG